DFRLAAAGRGIAGIIGEHPGLGVELADIDHRWTNSSIIDRERGLLIADDDFARLNIGAGLRIHDRALGCVARRTGTPCGSEVACALSERPPGGRFLRIASQCAPQDGGANGADQTAIMWMPFARLARSFLVPRRPGLATGGPRDG